MNQQLKDTLKNKYAWMLFALGVIVGLGLRSIGVV